MSGDGRIPRSLGELTPEWLTAALQGCGALGAERVHAVECEPLGDGEGFLGSIARLRPAYRPEAPAAPRSLVAKLPSMDGEARAAGELLGAYEREVCFYRDLAARVPLRVPRCFHADMDPNPAAALEAPLLRVLERGPDWSVRALMRLGAFFARHSRRRYVLLLEDLAPARTGDQVAGCSVAEAERALRSLARLHARFWEAPELAALPWLRPLDTSARGIHLLYRDALPAFARDARGASGPLAPLARWLDAHGVALTRALARPPRTLLHADFRLDNLVLGAATDDVIVFDWQVPVTGRAAYDVAGFLCGSFGAELDAAAERELLGVWFDALREHGVRSLAFADLQGDYRAASLAVLYRAIASVDSLEHAHPRGRLLMEAWLTRLEARLVGFEPASLRLR